MSTTTTMPRWDLSVYFTSVDSPEFLAAVKKIDTMLAESEKLFGELGVLPLENPKSDAESLARAITNFNELDSFIDYVTSYPHLSIATDSANDAAQAALSGLQPRLLNLAKIETALTAWIGTLELDEIIPGNKTLEDHAYPLQKAKLSAQHLMSPSEEALAADLCQTSVTAWSKLVGNYSSNIEVNVGSETIPMSACRALAYDNDPKTRQEAYIAELAAWKANELPLAAAMNSIKGANNTLAKSRGWESQLDITLFRSNMDRESLDAMMSAAEDAFPEFRNYLKAKAKLLGHSGGLPFYDLFATVGEDQEWSWDQGAEFVIDGFSSYSSKLGDFAARSFKENWHDVPPVKGKRDGAFCAFTRGDESRMLHNFKPAFKSVSTLAHELGHAYHNLCLKDRMPLQRATPMTLAETASIFCETIIKRRALASTSGQAKLAILEATIAGANQVVVDITSRFKFESNTIDRRWERELSPTELCEIMTQAQLDTYGDGLDANALHPYMWAAKPHYYSYMAFYNFPYMFGLLFALGLYKVYDAEPKGFHERYDDLLSSTGLFPAAELTNRFGIDIRDKAFWAGSLDVLRSDIKEYVVLANS